MNRNISFFRLDEQVLLTLAGVSLLSILVLGFKMITNKPCTDVIVRALNDSALQNTPMKFTADTKHGEEYLWEFGDGNSEITAANSIDHQYKNSGKYLVNVVVNGKCVAVRNVFVKQAIQLVEFAKPSIGGYDSVLIGELYEFREDGGGLFEKYEWTVDGIKAGGLSILQIDFTRPGPHKIKLVVNNNPNLSVERTVFAVKPKSSGENIVMPLPRPRTKPIALPDEPESQPLAVPDTKPVEVKETKKEEELPKKEPISKEGLLSLCKAVKDKQKGAQDFDKYICDMPSAKITYNGEQISISAMCEKLRALKKKADISIPEISMNGNRCVAGFSVKATNKENFLDKINPFPKNKD